MAFPQIFFFFLFLIHSSVNSTKLCPVSYCGKNYPVVDVRYPFRLEGHRTHTCNDYIVLKCISDNITTINLPFSGEFDVTAIYYFTQVIKLTDPQNCLAKRLMTLNLSSSFLRPFRYVNCTFYTCPRSRPSYPFHIIDCLSNNTNITVASVVEPPELLEHSYGCNVLGSWLIPGKWWDGYDLSETFSYFELTWNVSGCNDCEKKTDGSKSKESRFFADHIYIPLVVGLVVLLGVAFGLHHYKSMGSRNEVQPEANNTAEPVITSIQQSTILATASSLGLEDELKIRSCPFHQLLEEGASTSPDNGRTCTICLEEYHPNETVRYMIDCGHYFHSNCIDQWLLKNKTCPVCRTNFTF